jgi:hypothetical protein
VPTRHEVLAQRVSEWRTDQYRCDAFPAIAEFLDYASDPEPGISPTENIRIQKETIRKADLGRLFAPGREDEAKTEIANLRLQAFVAGVGMNGRPGTKVSTPRCVPSAKAPNGMSLINFPGFENNDLNTHHGWLR